MLLIVRVVVAVVPMVWIMRQVRKPSGWLGGRLVRSMNLSHAKLTDWGLEQVSVPSNASILDIGCGGGRTVQRLATIANQGTIVGLDYSSASVAASRETNAQEIKSGRVEIQEGSVVSLPFADATFDLVTGVETHYYWPNLSASIREVRRVLKPGGRIALIAETYRGGPYRLLYGMIMPLIGAAFLSDEEHRRLLIDAGFAEVETKHRPRTNWILATGRKPA